MHNEPRSLTYEGTIGAKVPSPTPMSINLKLEAWNTGWLWWVKANEPLELLSLDPKRPKVTVRSETEMLPLMREALKDLLVNSIVVFIWSHTDMIGIDNVVIEHNLWVNSDNKKVKGKIWGFQHYKKCYHCLRSWNIVSCGVYKRDALSRMVVQYGVCQKAIWEIENAHELHQP